MTERSEIIQKDLEFIVNNELPWKTLKKKCIMITGGSGFLASYLVKALLLASDTYNLKLKIICVVRNKKKVKIRLGRWLNHPALEVLIQDVSEALPIDFPYADIVIHSASQASPKYYGVDPVGTLSANTLGTAYLLDHCVKKGCKKFIYFSSGEVYGIVPENKEGITETDYGYLDPTQIRSCYGESKRLGETMCTSWSHQYGIHTSIIRPFHTYGPGIDLDDGRVFADFVRDVISGSDIILKSDGSAKRAFCYISDATIGFLTVMFKGECRQAYNVANPSTEISMLELATKLADLYPDKGIRIKILQQDKDLGNAKNAIKQAKPCITKIKALGWCPGIGIDEGFTRTIESFL